jgi:hypothetical protein
LCYHGRRHTEAHRYLLPQGKDGGGKHLQCTPTSPVPHQQNLCRTLLGEAMRGDVSSNALFHVSQAYSCYIVLEQNHSLQRLVEASRTMCSVW